MNTSHPDHEAIPSVNDQIHSDHKAIERERRSLADLLDPSQGDLGDFQAWKLSVLRRLRRFQGVLLMHFDLEEVTAFKEEVLLLAPQYATRLAKLEEEHLKIASDLNHVIRTVKRIPNPDEDMLERVHQRLTAVLAMLTHHEAQERDMFQSAMYQEQELGAGD